MAVIKGLNLDWIDFSKRVPQAKTDHITRQNREIPHGEHELQRLDIYLPEEGRGSFPVIVNVHGGGFCVCDKHDFHLYPTLFALQQGFAVAAVNYRLSPAVRYPEHYYDLERALLWIKKNGTEKSLDVNNISCGAPRREATLCSRPPAKRASPCLKNCVLPVIYASTP
jgi:acetyl esterase/lipase